VSISLDLRDAVERFVAAAGLPAVLDPGEEPMPLVQDQWGVQEWNGRVILQAWDARRNLVRKIVGIKEQTRDRISLVTERFPKAQGELRIADLAAPPGVELQRRASKLAFRDRFRLMLQREFPDWRLEEASSEPNLEQSLSPSYIRAFLRKGPQGLAAMAAPPGTGDYAGIVTFGLIWLSYLRRRESKIQIPSLLLFVPAPGERDSVARASVIDPASADCRIYVFDERDRARAIDFSDAGNVDSTLPPARNPSAPNAQEPEFPDLYGAEKVPRSDGSVSLRIRGLEFARWTEGKLSCGIARRKRCGMDTVIAMAREVSRVRCESEDALEIDRQHPLYMQFPEGWLESQVRTDAQAIDASLLPQPLYGQVPVFAGPDRAVIDLLGIDHTGRLVVVELKATADPQLPFQAIDYWLRVKKHLEAGDFERLGYFAGRPIRRIPPRIVLVAPALEFHSTTEDVLGYLSKEIEIVRVGLGAGWRRQLKVMFRLRGNERPGLVMELAGPIPVREPAAPHPAMR
jgi:hypothetical protein